MIIKENGELKIVAKGELENIGLHKKTKAKVASSSEANVTEKSSKEEKVSSGITITSANKMSETETKDNDNNVDDIVVEEVIVEIIEDEDIEETPKDKSESPSETIVITSATKEPTVKENSNCPIENINNAIKDAGLEEILTEDEESIVDELINRTKVADSSNKDTVKEKVVINKVNKGSQNNDSTKEKEVQDQAVSLLEKFKEYSMSAKFDKKCEESAKKYGVEKNIIKNKFISNFLGTIAKTLGLTITITGDIIISAVNFISYIINKIVEFAVDSLMKLITMLTVNCGETM